MILLCDCFTIRMISRMPEKLKDERLKWLLELGATDLRKGDPEVSGFLFGYWHGADHLRQIAARYPNIRDTPEEKEELMRLDHVLEHLDEHGIEVPTPRTWILQIDEEPPADLEFPLVAHAGFLVEARRGSGKGA